MVAFIISFTCYHANMTPLLQYIWTCYHYVEVIENNNNNNNKTFIWRLLQKASERQIQDHVKKNKNTYNRKYNIIP